MNRMVASQDWGKVRAEFPDLGIADVGVEDLLKHSQLLGTDELLVVEKATVLNDGALQHVLDLVLDLGSDVSRFHSNITSICLHWKRFPVNLSVFSGSKVRVELPGTGLGGVSVWPSAGYCGPRGEGGVNASGTELSAELREKRAGRVGRVTGRPVRGMGWATAYRQVRLTRAAEFMRGGVGGACCALPCLSVCACAEEATTIGHPKGWPTGPPRHQMGKPG